MKAVSYIFKTLSALILLFSWVFVVVNFQKMPQSVPIHYGMDGLPDGYGPKSTNWFLLLIQSGLFFLLLYFSRNSDKPGLSIPNNLKSDPVVAEFVVSSLLFLMMLILGLISYESVLNALGKIKGLSAANNYLLLALLLWLVGILIWSAIISKRKKMNL